MQTSMQTSSVLLYKPKHFLVRLTATRGLMPADSAVFLFGEKYSAGMYWCARACKATAFNHLVGPVMLSRQADSCKIVIELPENNLNAHKSCLHIMISTASLDSRPRSCSRRLLCTSIHAGYRFICKIEVLDHVHQHHFLIRNRSSSTATRSAKVKTREIITLTYYLLGNNLQNRNISLFKSNLQAWRNAV